MKGWFAKLPRRFPAAAAFVLVIVYLEVCLKLLTCATFFNSGLLLMPLFSLAAGLMFHALCSMVPVRARRWMSKGIVLFLFVLYATQAIYHRFFNKYLIVYSLAFGGVGQVLSGGIARNLWATILKSVFIFLLMAIPVVLYFVLYHRTTATQETKTKRRVLLPLGVAAALHISLTLIISGIPGLSMVQSGLFDPNDAVSRFGLLRTETLDIKYNMLGIEQELELEKEVFLPINAEEFHVSSVDFAALYAAESDEDLKEMNGYFAQKVPTEKNAYTGMYEGYNLVTVVAEGFSPYAIDERLTPTLYKMQQEGFRFTNFYTPIWGVSTSDGEYTVCNGLLPKAGVWSFAESSDNYMPYCLGNMFRNDGVDKVFAYHNNSHTYYHRDQSHPNMGYTYSGMGSGVEAYVQNIWPQSDWEMVAGSLSDYVSKEERFHAYYMTVSGHLEYSRENNAMADKNWALVDNLTCDDTLKAYYACNIELDRAMQTLLRELEAAGVADKTVIAITPDHYPYGLEQETGDKYAMWTPLLGHEVDTDFELYKSCFLLYCPGTTDAPVVDKVCYSADILPTLLNLFGFDYDSRLLAGRDILSECEGMAIMSNRSFVTDRGTYNAISEEFTPFDYADFESDEAMGAYVQDMCAKVNNTFKISAKILETDYYRYLFSK